MVLLGITNWPDFLTSLLAFFALYLIITISLNLEMGYAGIPNFGKVLYFMGGAAFSGSVAIRVASWLYGVKSDPIGVDNFLISTHLSSLLQSNIPESVVLMALTIGIGALAGGVLGYISTFPAIKLREDYLAMLLLGSAAFFQIFLGNYTPIINGPLGISIPDYFAWAGQYGTLAATILIAATALVVYVYAERLVRSPLGKIGLVNIVSEYGIESCDITCHTRHETGEQGS